MPKEKWNKAWNDENYEWPVTSAPDSSVVDLIGKQVMQLAGRVVKEAHADRGVVMDFPNPGILNTRLRKQVPRAECRRRAQVIMTRVTKEPLKVCIVCDAAHLWPKIETELA